MNRAAFNRIRADFLKSGGNVGGAALGSLASAVCLVLLLLVMYLFVDLLVWKGRIPHFAQLTAAQQRAFADEWSARSEAERAEALGAANTKRLVSSESLSPEEWETRWRAGAALALRERVGEDAMHADGGILSLVVRERNRWTGKLTGRFAAWNTWTWKSTDHSETTTYLTGLFILAFGIALIYALFANSAAHFAASATLDTTTRLRRAVFLHTYRLGSLAMRTAGTNEASELVTKKVDAVGSALQAALTAPFRHPLAIVLLFTFMVLVHFWLAMSFLLVAVIVWLVGGQIVAFFRREVRLGSREAERSSAWLEEGTGLLRLVKCFQMEHFNQSRMERSLAESSRANWRRMRGEALARPLLGSAALLAGIALLYLAARSVLAGECSVAGLAVMSVALIAFVATIASLLDAARRIRRGRIAAADIFEYLDRKGEAAEAADAEFLPPLTSRIEFRSVSLQEPGTGRMLLDNVTFAIPAGAKVAVVGADSAEKHALVYLLPRFLDPTTGEIRIEDRNIRWVTHESLRAQVAVVMSDDLTFSDTVANNIGCGDPQFNLPQIIEAAKLAHAHQFIERLPNGYETPIGSLGRSLKPGERFRVALARALLRDPAILVIEEPSGADDDTLALLDDTLERIRHGRTILFLANRVSTLRSVDRVFLLKRGKVDASGHHQELWQSNGTYRRLQLVADAPLETAG
ncbi:MAG: ABC transporter ATP-binding protein [Gemmataceae bacterium]